VVAVALDYFEAAQEDAGVGHRAGARIGNERTGGQHGDELAATRGGDEYGQCRARGESSFKTEQEFG